MSYSKTVNIDKALRFKELILLEHAFLKCKMSIVTQSFVRWLSESIKDT